MSLAAPVAPDPPRRMADALSIAHVDSEETFRGGQEALLQLALGSASVVTSKCW